MKRRKSFDRLMAILLCMAMLITYMPGMAYVFAEGGDEATVEKESEQPAKVEKSSESKGDSGKSETKSTNDAPAVTSSPVETKPAEEPKKETVVFGDENVPETGETDPEDNKGPPADDGEGTDVTEPAAKAETAVTADPDAEKKKENKEEFPAVELHESAAGVSVAVNAPEGALPEGVKLFVEPFNDSTAVEAIKAAVSEDATDAAAVDISFKDKDDKPVIPKEKVSVKLETSAMDGAERYAVVHYDGSASVIKTGSEPSFTFDTKDFSAFAIVGVPAAAEEAPVLRAAEDEGENEAPEMITVTFDPTTDPEEQLEPIAVEVEKGKAIGDLLPAAPEVPGYITKWVVKNTETEVTAETVVTEAFEAVVAKEKIEYTVTFVQEDGSKETRTTSIDDGFAINSVPEVTPKTNKIGKWVYPGTTNEFTVGTVISEDLTVNAYYEQNIFTVTFRVDGAIYEEMTTATGTTIVLPSDPVKAGATFSGWFTEPNGQGTQYTAESTVNEDLTLYAYFADQVRVSFIVKDKDGKVISEKSQYFIDLEAGDKITTLPDDPFVAGEVFDHWENENNGETVKVGYKVENSFNAVAVFKNIETYELTVHYYYMNGANRIEVGTQVYDLVEGDFAYTVTAPGYTIASEVEGEPTYYPSQPTITVDADQFTKQGDKYVYSVDDEFVAADAEYVVGHYLKDLTGDGYTLIERVEKVGVKNSIVTPDINNYAYATYDHRDENVTITETSSPKQELKVYYDRRDFTLSFNVEGGTYIDAVTAPYGTAVDLPDTATRSGYTFAGWYADAACTQRVMDPYSLKLNTTLYAKWNPAQVEYKIVYMVENADDEGYSFLKEVTRTAPTDTELTLTKAQADSFAPNDLDKQNFTFSESTTEKIKADGSSVIVVKYTRNVYTISWNGDVYRTNGNRRAQNQGSGSVTAKYGATITPQWVAAFNNRYPDYAWSPTTNNNDKVISIDTMPGRGDSKWSFNNSNVANVYAFDFSTTKTQTLNYWLENYESNTTKTRDGKTYGLYKSVTGKFNYLYDDSDFYAINGYTKDGYSADYTEETYVPGHWEGWNWIPGHYEEVERSYTLGNGTPNADLNVDFYYAAQTHALSFYNYDGTLISTQNVKLNADISGYLTSNVPDAPMDGAIWLGWFTDAEHKSAYSGGTKMPAGLVLYGNFSFPTRTLTYDSQGGTSVAPETHEYGFYATMPVNPTREHYEFLGWYTAADDTGVLYDWNHPVTEDITLYAHWAQETIRYTVHYYEAGTTTKVLDDKVVSDPVFKEGQSITEYAPTVAGHVADESSKTIELSFDDESNTIIFYYDVIPDKLTYTVNYVLKDNPDIKVAESKTITVSGTTTNVMEMAKEVDSAYLATQTSDADILGKHYRPTETSKELQLGLDNNVITFEYIPYTTSKIRVNYLDMDGKPVHDPDVTYVEKGDTFTVQNKAPEGYVYHHAYLDGTTTAPEATYQITGNEGNLVINIYYQKKLIIIANNKAKTYDGTALVSSFSNASDYTVRGNLRGDTVTSIEFDGSQTDAGTSATTPKNAQIAKGAQALTDPETYYSIVYVPGSLTVKPVSVYISVAADQWNTHSGGNGPNYYTGQTFNVGFTNPGKQHFNDDTSKSAYVSITSGQRALFKEKYGDAIWAALYKTNGALISEKDAGSYTVTGAEQRAAVAGVTVDGQQMMADPNYSITIYARDSILKIEPLPLTITSPSAEKVYDGTALTKSEGATLEHSYWTANIGGEWKAAETAAPGEVTLGTGETITFNVTGSQTAVGKSDNTYSIDWGENKASNYKLTANLGELEVTAGTLSITIKDLDLKYNGETQTGNTIPESVTGTGSTIENNQYKVEGLAEGQVLKINEYKAASGKDVDTFNNGSFDGATIIVMSGSGEDAVDVTGYYSIINTAAGKLTITPADLTVAAKAQSYTYDGSPKGEDNATYTDSTQIEKKVSVTGLQGTDTLTSIKLNGQETNAGTYSGKIVASDAVVGSATGNYNIIYTPGTLTIDKAKVKVNVDNKEKEYGETDPPLTATVLVEGVVTAAEDIIDIARTAGEDVGIYPITATLKDPDNYELAADSDTEGNFKIKKAELTVTVADKSKTYGTADPEFTATITGLKNGDKEEDIRAALDLKFSRTEGENVGTYTISASSDNELKNYTVKYVPGTLTITKAQMTVTATDYSGVYDDADHSGGATPSVSSGTTIQYSTDGGQTWSGTAPSIRNVGAVEYKVRATNPNYNDAENEGTLTVSSRPVTFTGKSATRTYTGSQIELTGVTRSSGENEGLVSGHTDNVTYSAKGTEVGEYDGTITAEADVVIMSNGADVTGNYDITVVNGKLTIEKTEAEFTISLADDEYLYDGQDHANTKAASSTATSGTTTYSYSFTEDGEYVSDLSSLKKKNAGEYTIYVKGTNPNYKNTATTTAKLIIKKRSVTLTSASGTKEYDGTALVRNKQSDVTVTGDGFVEGEGAAYTITGTQTEVGSSENSFTYELNEGTLAENYTITPVNGTLTVTKSTKAVTIVSADGNKMYDGSKLTAPTYTVKYGDTAVAAGEDGTFTLPTGDKLTITDTSNVVHVSDTAANNNTFTYVLENAGQYETVTPTYGTLTVTVRNVTLTSATDSKEYDGKPLTNSTVTVTGDGFAAGEGAAYSVTGTQTEVGSSENSFTYTLNEGTTASDYSITTANGTLTVTKSSKALTIESASGSKMYDGSKLTAPTYTVKYGDTAVSPGEDGSFTLPTGDKLTITDTSNVVHVADTAANNNTFTYELENAGQYETVTPTYGTLTITTRSVTLTSATDSKEYDGDPLTNSTVTVTGDGFATGEGAAYNVTGSQTEVGNSENTFTYKLNEGTTATDYSITTANGTLTVTKSSKAVTIVSADGNKMYDGSKLTAPTYTVKYGDDEVQADEDGAFTLPTGDKLTVTDTSNVVHVADTAANNNTFTYVLENADQYETVTPTYGTLTVTTRSVTLTSATDSKEYDGTALERNEQTDVAVTGDGFAEGEGAVYTITGTQTDVGSSENSFTYTLNEGTTATDYSITTANGTLTVTKSTKAVTIVSADGNKKYDGSKLTAAAYTVKYGDAEVEAGEDGTFTLPTRDKLTVTDTSNVVHVADTAANNNTFTFELENADQYETVTPTYGTLTITTRSVILTSATDSKQYDGKPLTNGTVTVTGDGFITGEGATYDVTGTQTVVGSSDNTFTYTLNEGTAASDYSVSTAYGTLTVSKTDKVLTISSDSETWMYNGAYHSKPVYTVKYGDETAQADETGLVFTLSTGDRVTISNAATVRNVSDTKDNNNTFSYELTNAEHYETVTTVYGTLSVTPRDVTLTSASDSKEYDGTPLVKNAQTDVTVTGDGFSSGEGAVYTITGSQTEVGSSENTFTYTLNEGMLAENYSITPVYGTLTVSKSTKPLTISSADDEWKYDGADHSAPTYTITYGSGEDAETGTATANEDGTYTYTLPTNDTITISAVKTVKNVSDTAEKNNTFTYVLDNADQYESVTATFGTLTITPRSVTLTSATDEKEYDGSALTNDEVTVTGDGFVEGEGATYDVTGTQTEVGNSANAFTYTLNEGTLAENYDIDTAEGTLTVTKSTKAVTIVSADGSKMYDGSELHAPTYTVKYGDTAVEAGEDGSFTLPTGDKLTITDTSKVKDVKDTAANNNTFTYVLENAGQYETVTPTYGTLTITKRSVTLTSATDEKEYDGSALTNSTVTVTGDGFVEGEGATYDVTGTQTEVGSSENSFTYTLNEGTTASDYSITTANGTLTVTKSGKALTIESASDSKMYDGSKLTAPTYTVKYGDTAVEAGEDGTFTLPTGDKLTVTDTSNVVHVADTAANNNTFTYVLANADQYETVTPTYGTLTITTRSVTMTSATDSEEYDGKPLTNDTVTVTGDGFITGEGASYVVTGTITEVGSVPNAFTYTLNEGTTASDYSITPVEGTLTVTKSSKKLTIKSGTNSWMYDGSEHSEPTYTITYGSETGTATKSLIGNTYSYTLSTGDKITISEVKAVKNVSDTADKNNTFTYVLGHADQYADVSTEFGTLTITPRSVTMTSATDTKEYDGTALTNDEVTVTGDGFITGEGAAYDVTGTQTQVGGAEGNNTFTYTLNEGTLADNYDITQVNGTLTVTKSTKAVTISSADQTWKYDGNDHSEPTYTVKYGEETATADESGLVFTLPTGDTITISNAATVKNVSDTVANNNTYKYVLANAEQYANVSAVYGTLTITPRSVTLTSATASKPYDGTALTDDTVTVSGDGFAAGEGVAYDVTGSQTAVGSSENKFTYTLNEGTLAENYSITPVNGTLTVSKTDKVVTIESGSNSWMYDGQNHSEPTYTITYGSETGTATKSPTGNTYSYTLSTGDKITISDVATLKNVGDTSEKNNSFTYVLENEDHYETVTPVYGTLTITPRSVTMTSATDTKAYDGTALVRNKQSDVTVSGDGFVSGEGAVYDITGTQTKVGNSENTFTYTLNTGTIAENYTITPAYGTLTVTESTKALVIGSSTKTWTYDSQTHTDEVYTVTYDGQDAEADSTGKVFTLPTGDTVTITATAEGVRYVSDTADKNNTYTYVLTNADQYSNVTAEFGTLSITKAGLTITADSKSKEYDGTPLTDDGWQDTAPEGLQGTDYVASVIVEGTITMAGTVANIARDAIVMNGTEDVTDNYDIEYKEGTLTVTESKKALKVESKDGSWIYDGSAHTKHEYTVTYGDESYDVTIAAGAAAGTVKLSTGDTVTITPADSATITHASESDVTNAFSYTVENSDQYAKKDKSEGKLTINPAILTIKTESANKEYDGTALTADGNISGFVTPTGGAQETATFKVTGSQTEVGKSNNTYSLTWDGTATESDYTLDEAIGELEVTTSTKELKVTSADGEWTYDGNAHTNKTYTVTYGNEKIEGTEGQTEFTLSTGDKLTVTPASDATITHASETTIDNAFTWTVANESFYTKGEDTVGKLTIKPATLTIVTDSADKEYDGTALTADGSISGFVTPTDGEQETATFKVTGSQTEVGKSDNTYTLTWDGTAVSTDYTLSESIGELEIKKSTKELKVESADGEWTYDGLGHVKHVYTVTYGTESGTAVINESAGTYSYTLSTGDVVTITPDTAAKITHVAETTVDNAFTWTVENEAFYTKGEDTVGELSVTPATLTIVTESANKEYDGTALTADGSIDGFANHETATFKVTGTQTEVGKSNNTYSLTWDGTATESDYTLDETIGELEVKTSTKELKVESADGEWTYDGNAHTNKTYTVTYGDETIEGTEGQTEFTLSTGDKLTVTPAATAKITHVAETTVDNAFTWTVENESFYTKGEDTVGKLTINPAILTIKTESANKEYDGTALTADGNISGFVTPTGGAQETATFKVTGTQTEVGKSNNTYTLTWDGTAVSTDYTLSESIGELEVKTSTKELKVESADGEWMYDGNAHTNKTYTVTYGDETIEGTEGQTEFTLSTGDKLTVTPAATAKITHVAETTVDNAFTWTVENESFYTKGEDTVGKLTINPAILTIKTESANKEYDGTALTADGNISGFVTPTGGAQETATFKVTGSQTEVGKSDNTYSLTWDGTATESDYTLDETIGELEVKTSTKELKVASADGEWTYDGNAHTNKTYTITYGDEVIEGTEGQTVFTLSTGDKLTVTPAAAATITHVAETTVDNAFTWTVENGSFYTKGTDTVGKLTITARPVTFTGETASREYTGSEIELTGITVGGDGLVGEHTHNVTYSAKGTEAGEYPGTITDKTDVVIKAGEADVTSNYDITTTAGKLTITATDEEFEISLEDDEYTYDAQPHANANEAASTATTGTTTYSYSFEEDGEYVSDLSSLTKVAAGEYTIYVKGTNPNYKGTATTTARLTIGKRDVKFTGESATKEYTGSEQLIDALEAFDGLIEGHRHNVEYSASGTEVGEYVGEITAAGAVIIMAIVDGELADVTANYNITTEAGKLTITATDEKFNISLADDTYTYDAQPHANANEAASTAATGTTTYSYSFTEDGGYVSDLSSLTKVAAGEYTIYVKGTNPNYKETATTTAKLTIGKREVTVSAADADDVEYDGKEHTGSAEYTFSNVVSGQTAAITYTPAKGTLPGTYAGSFEDDFKVMAGDEDVTANYTLTTRTPGELTITDRIEKYEIEVVANSTEATYDGKPHAAAGFKTLEFTVDGSTYTVEGLTTSDPSSVNVTTTANAISGTAVVRDAAGSDVTSQFTVTTKDGELKIIPKALTITADSDSKVYDGEPLTRASVTDGYKSDLAEGDTLDSVTVAGSQTLVGESANTPSNAKIVNADEEDVTSNYNITYAPGTLTVTDGNEDEPVDDDLVVSKSAESKKYGLGETVTFTVEATNIYAEPKTITFEEIEGVTLKQAEFENVRAGDTVSTEAAYTITEADILKGSFKNTVTAAVGDLEKQATATANTEDKNGHLTISKETTSETPDGGYALGDVIEYKITVTNDGNLTITDIEVTDDLTGDSWQIASLAPGANEEFTASYTVREADLRAGEVVNVATATGKSPDPDKPDVPVTPGEDPEPTAAAKPSVFVTKTTTNRHEDGTAFELGEEITYNVNVMNNGNQTITGITVTDDRTGDEWTIASLAPGASNDHSVKYKVTEADILAGEVVNVATATGTSPDDKPVSDEGSVTDNTADPNGHITIEKETTSTTPEGGYALGDVIEYKITVTNDGNLTITDIEAADELTGDTWTLSSLAPGASEEFTANYTVTEADILAGEVVNVATATGTSPDPDEPDVPVTPGEDPEPTVDPEGHITITKVTTSEPADGKAYALGEVITYRITATNDGNLTVTNVEVKDDLTGDKWTVASLAPGSSETFTASYTVTEADILAGEVLNVATATGTSPDPDEPDVPVTPGEDPEPTVDPEGHITITKTATSTPTNGASYALGETITYEITATNDGNLTVTNVEVEDELTGDKWTVASLAPGASETFTAEYTVTEADILAGEVLNVATAKGKSPDPDEPDVPVTPGEDPEPTDEPNGHITIEKVTTSEPANGKSSALGETITYEITAVNDGNVTLTDVVVSDDLTGDSWPIASFAPGASKTFTAEYTVTEEDILAGSVVNTATATGKDPEGNDPTVEPGVDPEPTDTPDGFITVTKETTNRHEDGSGFDLGETIEYSITAKNTGNVTVTDVVVRDDLTGDNFEAGSLKPGASKTFEAQYTVTEADILAGEVRNVAAATGKDPKGEEPGTIDGEVTDDTAAKKSHITVEKEATSTPANGTTYALGEKITYKITATNDGNLTLTDVVVSDDLTGDRWSVASLAPGASETFTASYAVTEADILAGKVLNVATAAGKSPDPDVTDIPVDPGEDEQKPDDPNGHITIDKTVTSTAPANGYALGDNITYEITATNDGNLTITDIEVRDDLTGDSWEVASLAPGASRTFRTSYTVTEKDILAGSVKNAATATGKSPDPDKPDVPVDPDEVEVDTEDKNAEVSVTKSANRTTNLRAGNTVRYTIRIENTGNVTLTNMNLKDSLVRFTRDSNFTLAPGGSIEYRYNYTVTAADVAAGSVVNTATVTGQDPEGESVTDSATVRATTAAVPAVTPAPTPTPTPAPAPDAGPGPEVIPDEPVPEVEPEIIPDDPTPQTEGVWALLNLISAIATALGAVVALFRKKEEEDEDGDDNAAKAKAKAEGEEDEKDNRGKKMLAAKIAGAIAGVAAPITFILTEDMSLPMAWTDKWTLLMIAMLAVQIIAAVLNKRASKLDDEKDENVVQ